MIEFHLDARSGVAPYLQIVHQVRHALRLGMLREGDQLPTVKDVVARLAINPNTVLKAYNELDHEGLVAARPGIGTFVTQDPRRRFARGPGTAAPGPAAVAGQGSSRRPRRGEHRGPLSRLRSFVRGAGDSVNPVLQAEGLGKRYGRRWALRDCSFSHSLRSRGRARGAQRRREDDAAPPGRRPAAGDDRDASSSSASLRRPARSSWRASGSSRRTRPRTRPCRSRITSAWVPG